MHWNLDRLYISRLSSHLRYRCRKLIPGSLSPLMMANKKWGRKNKVFTKWHVPTLARKYECVCQALARWISGGGQMEGGFILSYLHTRSSFILNLYEMDIFITSSGWPWWCIGVDAPLADPLTLQDIHLRYNNKWPMIHNDWVWMSLGLLTWSSYRLGR